MVTNEAIITINAGILTLSGIRFFNNEIKQFERTSTNIVANPIPKPFVPEVVTPRVGHIPKRRTNVGFSLIIPRVRFFISAIALLMFCCTRFCVCVAFLIRELRKSVVSFANCCTKSTGTDCCRC